MPRASDSPGYRASDSPSVATWASDPAGPDAWASDPAGAVEDRWPAPATGSAHLFAASHQPALSQGESPCVGSGLRRAAIVAPAAFRQAYPATDTTVAVTMALGLTFPFNLVFGIPLYWAAASLVIDRIQ